MCSIRGRRAVVDRYDESLSDEDLFGAGPIAETVESDDNSNVLVADSGVSSSIGCRSSSEYGSSNGDEHQATRGNGHRGAHSARPRRAGTPIPSENTVTLTSDDELNDAAFANAREPSVSRANKNSKKHVRGHDHNASNNGAENSSLLRGRSNSVNMPSGSKRKRQNGARNSERGSRRPKRTPNTAGTSRHSFTDTDSDVEILSISNSVGDMTLANINQYEADERFARELQSRYDREAYLYHLRRRPGSRQVGASVSGGRGRSLIPVIRSSSANASPSAEGRRHSRDGASGSNSRNRRNVRSAAPDGFDFEDILDLSLSDDDVEPAPNTMILRRGRNIGGVNRLSMQRPRPGRSTSLFDEFLTYNAAVGHLGHRSSEAHRGNVSFAPPGRSVLLFPNPGLQNFGLGRLHQEMVHHFEFEHFLDMADHLGDADMGLNVRELDTYTTKKTFNITSSSSTLNSGSSEAKESCSICMTDYEAGDELRILPCIHNFHQTCVEQWLKTKPTCPICRIDVRT